MMIIIVIRLKAITTIIIIKVVAIITNNDIKNVKKIY